MRLDKGGLLVIVTCLHCYFAYDTRQGGVVVFLSLLLVDIVTLQMRLDEGGLSVCHCYFKFV